MSCHEKGYMLLTRQAEIASQGHYTELQKAPVEVIKLYACLGLLDFFA